MNSLKKLIFLFTFYSFIFPAITQDTDNIPDSLLTKNHVYKLTYTDPEKASDILSVMRKYESLPGFILDIVEGDLYYNTGRYRQALILYQKALESDSVKGNDLHYMEQLHRMISTYDKLNETGKQAEYVKLLMTKADETGNQEMKSVACFNMGKMLYYQGEKENAFEYIYEGNKLMENSDYIYKYDNLRYNYNTLLIMQKRDGLYNEALETLDKLQEVIHLSNNEPYIDKLTERELKNYYSHKTVILSKLRRKEEADEAYREWKQIPSVNYTESKLITPYFADNNMQNEIIELHLKVENQMRQKDDTVSYSMLDVKRSLAKAFYNTGDFKKSAIYFHDLYVINDSIKKREQNSTALEFAAIYGTQEKEKQLLEQKAMVQKRNILLASSIIIIFLLSAVLILVYRNMVETRNKNRAMLRQIKEMKKYKGDYIRAISINSNPEKQGKNSLKKTSHDELYMKLIRVMNEDKLYLNPKITRDELVNKLNTNKNLLLEALKKNTGLGLADYINNLRLEESLNFLDDNDSIYSMEEIAEQVGLSKSTFYRIFKEKYGMTPREYRNIPKE